MITVNRPARLNRSLIALVGVLLLAAGGYLIAAQRGWVGWVDRSQPLTPGAAEPPTWVFYAVIAGAAVLALLCLRWLSVQLFRLPSAVTWQLAEAKSAGRTTLSSATAARAVAADIESFDTVASAAAWLSGPGRAPELHLVVTATPEADLTELRRRILGEAVARLREALEVGVIPVTMELRLSDDETRVR
ncbi:alkaline shock response membrane anchor protein AmaP [Nocardia otitidiscaviarum]|uniref:Alkaline shock response membrane anchor protein AmaP n=1 Tax=Nocardia otitidiscaviarum TaxID=1823 RepID=A0A516NUU8_9NOCA|nr:alkaline shock response membrane anchor protein AmaP [Nocardia otitidiscaviarum]MCP9622102.1 alkaline shock response membrane anchor protein AmaP [Nocardia otitidiscaviarum]QDP82687.1 alkaline shock response membrane anchor protein AmaP [Nocardia otitidiscaviarum]